MSKAWAGGSSRRWRATRLLVLTRDGALCQLRVGGVCVRTATHVHHIHGKASGCTGCAMDVPSHLVAACAPCNLSVGDPGRASTTPPRPRARTQW